MRVGRAEMHEVVKPSFREYRVFPFFLFFRSFSQTSCFQLLKLTLVVLLKRVVFFCTFQTEKAARIFSDAEHPTYSGKAVAFLAAGKQYLGGCQGYLVSRLGQSGGTGRERTRG